MGIVEREEIKKKKKNIDGLVGTIKMGYTFCFVYILHNSLFSVSSFFFFFFGNKFSLLFNYKSYRFSFDRIESSWIRTKRKNKKFSEP